MKRSSLTTKPQLLLCWALGVAFASSAFAQADNTPFRSDRLLVLFAPATVASAKDAAHAQAQAIGVLHEYTIVAGLQLVQVPDGQVLNAVAVYKANPNVLNAEPDYLMPTAETIPNDTYFYDYLYGPHNRGQTISGSQFFCSPPPSCPDPGVIDADIDAPLAWDLWTGEGNPTFRIAVADTGVNYNHPDLKENIWINPDEDTFPSPNGNGVVDGTDRCRETPPVPNGDFNCQDDPPGGGNGYIDDIVGYDFFDNDANPADSGSTHGTHVAGTIAAVGNNDLGVTGVNWRAKIVPLRICVSSDPDEPGECSVLSAIRAIEYCRANDIRISNHSWGGKTFTTSFQQLYNAIQAAQQAQQGIGHLVVAAAQNLTQDFPNLNNDVIPIYPASFGVTDARRGADFTQGLNNVISVAATDNNDAVPGFSHYGATHVHLGAPGTNILSTSGANTYGFKSGTSMATPHVTGVGALVWSRFDTWDYLDVKNRILSTVRKVDALKLSGQTPVATEGVVNAYRAIAWDCNHNGDDDATDISSGTSKDVNGFESDCCVAHDAPGCTPTSIATRVCTAGLCSPPICNQEVYLDYCCISDWDQNCASYARQSSISGSTCACAPDQIPDECQPVGLPIPGKIVWDPTKSCVNPAGASPSKVCTTDAECGVCTQKKCSGLPANTTCTGTGQGTCPAKQCSGLPANTTCTGTGQGTCPAGQTCNSTGQTCNFVDCITTADCTAISAGTCTAGPTGSCWEWPNDSSKATTRSLRFGIQPPACGTALPSQAAIKVTMIDLQHPQPYNLPAQAPPNLTTYDTRFNGVCVGGTHPGHHCDFDFDCPGAGATCPNPVACTADPTCTDANDCTLPSNTCARWVGKPGTFLEFQDFPYGATYRAARLQCTPYYQDWTPEELVTVVGAEILPSSEYSVQVYGASCMGAEAACTNVSTPVTMYTRRSGDTWPNFNPPATTAQPDVLDTTAVVNKVKQSQSPVYQKSITQLFPNLPNLNADVNANDIAIVVDAVRQVAYPFRGPCPCPSLMTCATTCGSSKVCEDLSAESGGGPGALCVKTCIGGANASDPCINNTHCPGGTCGAGGETPGRCRDKCGRCSP